MNDELLSYIKPGEFAFCSRCGTICKRANKNFMCTRCIHDMFSRTKMTELEKAERIAEQSFEQQISDICKIHREFLTVLRRDAE